MAQISSVALQGVLFRAGWRATKGTTDRRGYDTTPDDTVNGIIAALHQELRDVGWEIAPVQRSPKA